MAKKVLKNTPKNWLFSRSNTWYPKGLKLRGIDRLRAFALLKSLGQTQPKDEELVNWAMAQTQTAELAEQLVSDLSGGQQQRVFLAMTLAQDAELVLLDEPTTYLDLNRQAELMGMMRQMQQNGKNRDYGVT